MDSQHLGDKAEISFFKLCNLLLYFGIMDFNPERSPRVIVSKNEMFDLWDRLERNYVQQRSHLRR